ncbi:MAG TPA: PEP-CTERM sorting domain-containing protein [Bryobacteraceae bacterium]|nr:PEP-CTERM sorting domain-containing protein [Bryobacteraceae bacterium]
MTKVIGSLLFCAALCSASSITYDVDWTVGNGTLTGEITTDGTIGAFNNRLQITGFDLTVNDGVRTDEISSDNGAGAAFFGSAADLTATATDLTYDFGPGSDALLFMYDIDGNGGTFVCISQTAGCTGTGNGISIGAGSGGDQFANIQYLPLSGSHVIATVAAAPNGTPEPSTLALIGAGFSVLGFARFRKNHR